MRKTVMAGLVLSLGAALALFSQNTEAPYPPAQGEAPAAFDGQTNGLADQPTHAADQVKFDEIEQISDGLGPLYNAQSCRECHQNPTSEGGSQTAELRVGHRGANGQFENPSIPINELQERVPDTETIQATRMSVNLFGDGFVEAVADQTLLDIARDQCHSTHGRICGQVLYVPILEAPGKTSVGRFGWKDQHASLLSFAGDAYLNEMGITNKLFPDEITLLCNTVSEPNDTPGADGLEDIDRFARFIRATKAPPRDAALAETPEAREGSRLFDKIGCNTCHVRTMATAPAATVINGGAFTVPDSLGNKQFYPYGDFLLHNVDTGDGIAVAMEEHYGKAATKRTWMKFSYQDLQTAANKVRTAPLWGVRTHSRLMHDGDSLTLTDAIKRHGGEAEEIREKFRRLKPMQKEALLTFLRSL
ncbi:MAG: hypothetical protein DMG21_13910 [Acidobacteria bacterium]|nr:MAG: hypothetical protein DMG21_13910 [Acidobacteriota bacterium]